MPKQSLYQKFKDIPISRKLYATVGLMAILIMIELAALLFSVNTLSSVRAYVGAEGLWSKAQKDAVYNLYKYSQTGEIEDYHAFEKCMMVHINAHKTLVELYSPEIDMEVAGKGLLDAGIHPDDVEGMLLLFKRFYFISYINEAIGLWNEADSLVHFQLPIGAALKEAKERDANSDEINKILAQIGPLNEELTIMEDRFSEVLGEGSRWLENVLLKLLFVVALTVELTGLIVTVIVSRNLKKGLDTIIISSNEVAKGNFKAKAKIYSKDEIGRLAESFNQMSNELEKNISGLLSTQTRLNKRNLELKSMNSELVQFAYVASHDLQEPLRTITSFVQLLQAQNQNNKLDEKSEMSIQFIAESAQRMSALVKALLDYSRIGKEKYLQKVDVNELVGVILRDLGLKIKESEAEIILHKYPVIQAYAVELRQLIQNLISNALKFQSPGNKPEIEIKYNNQPMYHEFTITDNGIGIPEEHKDRIFLIFQRLHTRNNYEGTGIGLANCKKIVDLHEGTLAVKSKEGVGSSFTFTIAKKLI